MSGTARAGRPVVPTSRFAERLARAAAAAEAAGLDALLIGVGSDLRYLAGYEAMPLERLTMLVIRPGTDPYIVVPRLERGAAEAGLRTPVEIRTWAEQATWLVPRPGASQLRDSAGFAPASLLVRRPGICARRGEDSGAGTLPPCWRPS